MSSTNSARIEAARNGQPDGPGETGSEGQLGENLTPSVLTPSVLAPSFPTMAVGSFPHTDGRLLSEQLATMLDIPCWPQLPRRSFRENMYVQFSAGLPAIVEDEAAGKVSFDTSGDISDDLERFYSHYLEDDLDAFALTPKYAAGFFEALEVLEATGGQWAKGQVTGPISFGLTVTDQNLRPSLYDELLAEPIVKKMALNARWQIRQLQAARPNVIMFVDEPYMAAFGSSFISLSRKQAITMLEELFEAIHREGALAGVHCCANTDWSVLLATSVDILNLDAYGYLENLALYPAELRDFLGRGGDVAWGIVPNNSVILSISAGDLAQRMREGLSLIEHKAKARGINISADELAERSLLTTSCGLSPASTAIADRALEILTETALALRKG